MVGEDRHGVARSTAAPAVFPHFRGRTRQVARALWWLVLALVVVMTVLAVPLTLNQIHTTCPMVQNCPDHRLNVAQIRSLAEVGLTMDRYVVYATLLNLIPPLAYLAVAAVLFTQKTDDGMAYFTSLTFLLFGGVTNSNFVMQLAASEPVWALPYVLLTYLGSIFIVALFFIFPTGRVEPRWMRPVLVLWCILEVVDIVSDMPLNLRLLPEALRNVSFYAVFLAIIYAQVYHYRHVSNALQRRQSKWVVYGIVVALTILMAEVTSWIVVRDIQFNVPMLLLLSFGNTLALTIIPVTFGLAIFRSHLFDIDLLINRTLVYSAVTAILAGVLAVSIELSKRLFLTLTGAASDVAPILATLVVVAAFDPVKKNVEHAVDKRVKYDPRSFGEFGEKLRTHIEYSDPTLLLTAFLREAVKRFDAQSGAVYLMDAGQRRLVNHTGSPGAPSVLSIALACGERPCGLLTLGPRSSGEPYDEADRQSLEAMGRMVAQSVELAGDNARR
jgi:hypothetical protein